MDLKRLEAELSQINEKKHELEEQLKQCKSVRDYVQEEKIRKDLKILANKAKHLLFKLGKFRYPEEEFVEYEPGQYMDANVYHWLKD